MGVFDNYRREGQMSIFDFLEPPKQDVYISDVGIGAIFRYLRYGPHTLVPEAKNKCKTYLDSVNGKLPKNFIDHYGDPKKWSTLPCSNCEYGRSGTCRAGAHTCHYEYDVLICDAFKQTIVGEMPTLPCDTCGYCVKGCCDYPCTPDDYCILGDKHIPKTQESKCKYSGHACNKENVWAVADTLDDKPQCPHVCCRNCEIKTCGARCNGS